LIIRDCDLLNCNTDPKEGEDIVEDFSPGVFISRKNEGLVLEGCKLKDGGGKALIVGQFNCGDSYVGNWMQPTMSLDAPQKAMYFEDCASVNICENWFSPAVGKFAKTSKYELLEFVANKPDYVTSFNVRGNVFEIQGSTNVEYFIKATGSKNDRKFRGCSIENNRFGKNISIAGNRISNIDTAILIDGVDFDCSSIKLNTALLRDGAVMGALIRFRNVVHGEGGHNEIAANSVTRAGARARIGTLLDGVTGS
jgi:hypothetical protein